MKPEQENPLGDGGPPPRKSSRIAGFVGFLIDIKGQEIGTLFFLRKNVWAHYITFVHPCQVKNLVSEKSLLRTFAELVPSVTKDMLLCSYANF